MTRPFNFKELEWFGDDVYISDNAVIKRPQFVSIGSHVAIDDFVYITTKAAIGSWVHISPHVSVIGGVDALFWLGNFCTISAGARIICRGDAMLGYGLVGPLIPSEYRDELLGGNTHIESYCAVGTNAVLMPDVSLVEGVVVGAGAVVTKSILEPWTIWIGSPAIKLKDRRKDKMLRYAEEMIKDER